MTVYGNGFLAYHIEVNVTTGQAAAVKASVAKWKSELCEAKTWPGFPDSMVTRLSMLPSVTQVVCEGPQSSVLIPLRMVHGMTGLPVTMSGVLGSGPITQAIEDDLKRRGIDLECTKRHADYDAPIEFSFREPDGHHESLRLYPASRNQYRAGIGESDTPRDHLILNRYNKALNAIATDVAIRGGIVSFRPRELGRYDRIEDYISLLPLTQQLMLSTRHGVMRKLAQQAGVALPRKWPEVMENLADDSCRKLVEWLFQHLPKSAIVVLHSYEDGSSGFYEHGSAPVLIDSPTGYDHASRAARIQGVLLALSLSSASGHQGGKRYDEVIETAYRGTEKRPWIYHHERTNVA